VHKNNRTEPLRNRLMVAMAYDGALRREELVHLEIDDLKPAHALIHLRAETTKGKRARDVAFGTCSRSVAARCAAEALPTVWVGNRPRVPGRPITELLDARGTSLGQCRPKSASRSQSRTALCRPRGQRPRADATLEEHGQ
jgi:integrase